jgi:hypothetical protein
MTTHDKGTFQMLWDCPSCDTPKLLGLDHRYCPNCGFPQAAEKRYFPAEGEEIAVADHVYHGVDWQCPGCDTPNSAAAQFCGSCGSPREGDAKDVGIKDDTPPPPPPEPPKKSKKGCFIFGCGGLLLVALVFAAVAIFWKKDVALEVTGHSWERSIEIEKFQAVSESDWCDSMPSKAYSVSRSREVRDHKQVADGETCTTKNVDKGDGSFEKVEECKTKYREEPIYDDKCSYKVDKWKTARTAKADGSSLSDTPAWPDVGSLRGGSGLGAERQGSKRETYTVHYREGDGDTHDCAFAESKWKTATVGSTWSAEAGVMFSNLDCDSLSAN